MCGIFGIIRFDGRAVDAQGLRQMGEVLRHRGPEGFGVQVFASPPLDVGLGHTRLRIIDRSEAADQPMGNEDRTVWITFNGEIYNYRALRSELERRGARCRTASDTEVVLRAYEMEGAACLKRLDGMFAMAVWDQRAGRLLLARDRVGKKPLFYHHTPRMLAFASEIKALLRSPDIPGALNEEALPSFFLFGYVPTPTTLYQGVRKLPPGHLLEIDARGDARLEAYWDPAPFLGRARSTPSWDEARSTVRTLATEAVGRRLIADVPIGAFLSGGIDSSIIVGIMSRQMRTPVRTFSIGFTKDPKFNETSYARIAAERFRTRHTEFIVEPSSVELVERLVWHHDGPFSDSSAIPTYLLSKLTREHVTVALTGDGGDELFAGYLRFYAAVLCERVPQWTRIAVSRFFSGLPAWGHHRSAVRRLQKFAASASLPFSERFSRWIAVFYEDLPRLLRQEGLSHGHAPKPLAALEPSVARVRSASPLAQLLYLNLKTYLLDDLLVKTDRCSMAHALEARSPFLDSALLEYAFSLPDAMKLRWGQTKVILRQAFADLVPPAILRRGKMGFGVPLRMWFAEDLREYLHDVLLAPNARLRPYVDQAYVRELVEGHLAWQVDYSDRLWTLLTFEVWLRDIALGARHDATERMPAGAEKVRG